LTGFDRISKQNIPTILLGNAAKPTSKRGSIPPRQSAERDGGATVGTGLISLSNPLFMQQPSYHTSTQTPTNFFLFGAGGGVTSPEGQLFPVQGSQGVWLPELIPARNFNPTGNRSRMDSTLRFQKIRME